MAAVKQVAVFAGLVLALLVSVPAWANQSAESSPTVGPAPGYLIDDGVIIIATVESLPNRLKPRVYDIADLL